MSEIKYCCQKGLFDTSCIAVYFIPIEIDSVSFTTNVWLARGSDRV